MDTREVQTALVALGYALVVDGVAGLFFVRSRLRATT